MKHEWLTDKITLDVALREHETLLSEFSIDRNKPEISNFIQKLELFFDRNIGCEFYRFDSGHSSFVALSGRRGYSALRDGDIVDNFLIWVS